MKLSDLQWDFPDTYVRQTAELLKTNTKHRFIIVLIDRALLQFRSGLVTWHKDLVTSDERSLVEGGGFVSSGTDEISGKRFLHIGGVSGDFQGIPVRVVRPIVEHLRQLLADAGVTFDEVRTDEADASKINPFWRAVR